MMAFKDDDEMAFGCWKIGVHIQQDKIVAIALQRARCGWALRRWWQLPLPVDFPDLSPSQADAALITALSSWRRELPWQHTVSLAFPANRTLQKTLPRPALTLRDSEQAQWIASTMAQQVEMNPDALCFDYQQSVQNEGWNVTAAQRKDIERLERVARALHLRVAAITPDACALRHFQPWLSGEESTLVWHDKTHWLWASASGWGSTPLEDAPVLSQLAERLVIKAPVRCRAYVDDEPSFNPWNVIGQTFPPLPEAGDDFAVAIALALGGAS